MTNKFSCFLTQKGRWLTATLFLLFSLGIGNVWAASKTLTADPTGIVTSSDNVTVTGDYVANATMASSSNVKAFNTNNSSVHIYSLRTNITKISFDICLTGNGSGEGNAVTIKTTTNGNSYTVPDAWTSAKKDGSTDILSLTNIQAKKSNNTALTTVEVTFSSAVKGVELVKAGASYIKNVVVTYDNSSTTPTLYYAAHLTGKSAGTVDTNPGGATISFTSSGSSASATILDKAYYKKNGNDVIDLGSGHTFQEGDQIVAQYAGTGNNSAPNFQIGSTTYGSGIAASNLSYCFVSYTVVKNDGVAGQHSVTLGKVSTNTSHYAYYVYRAPAASCTSNPTAPTAFAKTAVTATTATFSITDGADAASYDLYYADNAGSPADPTNSTAATTNVTTKTPTIEGLTGGTTYKIWVRSVCDNTHKSAWVALGSGTFTTLQAITPSLSYANNPLILTVRTTGTPNLIGNTGNGTVTWNSSAEGVATVDESGNITAVAAGTTTITASIAANGGYAAGEATATVKVVAAPLGVIDQKLATGEVAWDASVIVTNDYTNVTSLTALSQHGSATASGNGNTSNGGQTSKIGTATGDFNDANYLELAFTIKSGMEFEVSSVTIPVQPVSSGTNNFKAVLSDGTTDIEGTSTNLEAGKLNNISFGSYGTLKGNVTLKIYAWGWGNGYRLGKNIVIDGELKAPGACTTPTIAWDGDQPEDAFVSDVSKTFAVTSNYATGVGFELSANTCGATVAAKEGSGKLQWVVSFTQAGSVTITPKVTGDGSTYCAGPVSATAKTLTVTQAYDVTFNMNGHGASIAKQVVADGGKATAPYVADVADWVFGGWFTDAECTAGKEFDFANTTITADRPLYAKWTVDACASERKSLSKVVLTSASEGTVSGHNGDEYAGAAVIAGLNGTQDADLGGGSVTGYKLSGGGSGIVFATLKKGSFQAGDKVVIGITKKQDTRELNGTKNLISIYYGTNASDAALLTTIYDVSATGYYTYRLTEADVTAIGEKKGIGVFRESSNGQNPYIYSVEITGCRSFAVSHDVTFDMKSHGTQVGKQTLEVGAKVTEPTEPEAAGYIFGGWYKETTLENTWNFATDVVPDYDITLYAKWTEDPCTDRQSLSKVVLTSKTEGAVSGFNSKEYAGDAVIGGLNETQTAEVDLSHEGNETGYKLAGSGTGIVFATLAKGTFQEGDKVVVTITKQQDAYKVEEVGQPILDIYYGTSKDDATFLTTIDNVTAAGSYTYRLTAADVTAIGSKNGIGVFRPSSGRTQNPYVYSVEITGCREWSVSHNVTFNMHDHGSAIAAQSVYEGGKVTKPAVVEPEGWAFDGWYKESTYENLWDFDLDVMGTSDIELHAKWESEAGVIKLFDGEGNLNTTNFISPAKTTIEISSVTYPTLADFGSNRTSLAQAKQADMVMYSATTDATKIKFELYNANGSAKSAYLWMIEEGDDAATAIDVVEVPGNKRLTTSYYTFNGTKNRSFYLTSGSKSDIKVMQVKVMDNGTAIPQFGKAGYSVNFNQGRLVAAANGTVSFEGASIHSNDEYSVLNSSNLKPKTYIQFNNAVANTTVKITKASSNKYYVTNDLDNKGAEYSTDQEIVLSTTGTWYIGSVNSGSVAALSKIEFIAPKCETPAFNALANSNICSGDPYVALDGTGTVSDGGTITYKWYAQGSETVLATTATYTPTADGSYYVKALHHVDGYTDNEATSDVVTVTTHAGTVISEPLVDLRGAKDAVVKLTVTASGKNLSYAWKESATIDGTYTDVAGAADDNELDVTITEGMDKYYKVIVHSDCGADQESVAHVTQFVPVSQQDVTASIVWDWTEAASDNTAEMKNNTTPARDAEFIMANGDARIYNNANFWSDKLVIAGQYAVRGGNYFQGGLVKFHTTVAGVVRVTFSHTGTATEEKPARELYVNGVATGATTANTTRVTTAFIDVPAGDVSITAQYIDPTKPGNQYVRVYKVEFYALAHQRTTGYNVGDLGTVCLEDATFIEGANLYELAGLNENGYLAFDEITTGNLEAGKPYLFEVTNPSKISFYKPVGAAHTDTEEAHKGMIGTFSGTTLYQGADNLYYFSGRHIWKVNDFTVAIPIPDHRCYVDYDAVQAAGPAQAPAAGRRRVTLGVQGKGTATDINNVEGDNVQPVKMMINGQLFILRGEKLYDATGRLVK